MSEIHSRPADKSQDVQALQRANEAAKQREHDEAVKKGVAAGANPQQPPQAGVATDTHTAHGVAGVGGAAKAHAAAPLDEAHRLQESARKFAAGQDGGAARAAPPAQAKPDALEQSIRVADLQRLRDAQIKG